MTQFCFPKRIKKRQKSFLNAIEDTMLEDMMNSLHKEGNHKEAMRE